MNFFVEFIQSSYKLVENRPKPYGLFHLVFVVLSLAVIVAVCYAARKSRDKTFRIVMFSVGTLLLISEVYKQLYYVYAKGAEGYDWHIFPFQFCSIPMYLSVLIGCMKKCKVRDAMCEYMACFGLLGGVMAYIEPSGILNECYFTLIHSCLWHALLIFMALYILVTGNACHNLKNYVKTLPVFGSAVTIATVLNVVFRSKPSFNMCYISPFYNTPLAVFSSFDAVFQAAMGQYPGRIVSILLYIIALVLGSFALYFAACFIKKKCAKSK